MLERAEILTVDEEGILVRSFTSKTLYYFDGEPDAPDSPLMEALMEFYREEAPATLMCAGYETPRGVLRWESEFATPPGNESDAELGERLFLVMEEGERWLDELAYQDLSRGEVPEGWLPLER